MQKLEVGVCGVRMCVYIEYIHVSGYVYTCVSIYLSVYMLEYMNIWVCIHMDVYRFR